MGLDIAGEELGETLPLQPGETGETRLQLGVVDIAVRIVAPGIDEGDDLEPGAGREPGDFRDGEGAVARMEHQVKQLRISTALVVDDGRIAAQPIGHRQFGQQPAGNRQALARRVAGAQHFQHRLGVIDADASQRAIEHQPDPAGGIQDGFEGGEAGGRVLQMMQHPAAVDVVEGPQPQARQIEQRAGMKADIREAADLGPRLGDAARGGGEVEIVDVGGEIRIGEMLAQHDERVAGAPARHQHTERTALAPFAGDEPAAEDVVIDFLQMARRAFDQAGLVVLREALGIGIGLVLRRDAVCHATPIAAFPAPPLGCSSLMADSLPMVRTTLPVALRSTSWARPCLASARSRRAETNGFSLPSRHQPNICAKAPGSRSAQCCR